MAQLKDTTVNGILNATEQVQDNGQRVYSPLNEPPSVNAITQINSKATSIKTTVEDTNIGNLAGNLYEEAKLLDSGEGVSFTSKFYRGLYQVRVDEINDSGIMNELGENFSVTYSNDINVTNSSIFRVDGNRTAYFIAISDQPIKFTLNKCGAVFLRGVGF